VLSAAAAVQALVVAAVALVCELDDGPNAAIFLVILSVGVWALLLLLALGFAIGDLLRRSDRRPGRWLRIAGWCSLPVHAAMVALLIRPWLSG